MAIDDIKLSNLVIREWYGDLLPVEPNANATATGQPASTFKFLGNNRRNIAIVVHAPGIPFLPDNQLVFLTRILEACRMTIADVAIVNGAATPVSIDTLRERLQPTTILLFGVDPAAIRLPINFPQFKPQAYDRCTYLTAPPLEELVPDSGASKLLKSKLWVCLKTIFDV